MASDLNTIVLSGRLGADPELRTTPSGAAVTTLRVASNRWVPGRDGGEGREETTWLSVVCWNGLAERVARDGQKGAAITVQGRLQLRAWDDTETGQKREATEIVAEQLQLHGPRRPEEG